MSKLRSAAKLVAAQALGVFIVFNIVAWTICFGFSVHALLENYGPKLAAFSPSERMAKLPNYAGIDWTKTHFEEFHSLRSRYMSHIGWRREVFEGKTIKLEGPYARRASVGAAQAGKRSVYFFGGSTMWGTGVDDANTIPSLVTQIGGFPAQNYGESGWIAHQSLSLLILLLQEGHRPDVVVFYDGVNDVAHKCRRELTPTSHAREQQIRAAMSNTKPQQVYGLQHMLKPLMGLAGEIRRATARSEVLYDCHRSQEKAQQIADNLLQDWDVARRLIESYGGKFIAILQPVAFYGTSKLDSIRLSDTMRKQFQAVYPLIKPKMAGRPGLYDLTAVLDHDEYFYVDFCHLSPNGNRYVAQKLVEVLGRLG
jgi:lysophospholipase L1-like esterase